MVRVIGDANVSKDFSLFMCSYMWTLYITHHFLEYTADNNLSAITKGRITRLFNVVRCTMTTKRAECQQLHTWTH